jgi:excisionase family DNA binding protein
MSAARKLVPPEAPTNGPLLRLYREYLKETREPAAAAIFAIESYRASERSKAPAPEPSVDPELLTVRQAARKYNLGERTVYRMVEDGLPVTRVGRAVRIKPRDLARWLEDQGTVLR